MCIRDSARLPRLARARVTRARAYTRRSSLRRVKKLDGGCADSFAAMAKCIDRNNHDWLACAKQKEALHACFYGLKK